MLQVESSVAEVESTVDGTADANGGQQSSSNWWQGGLPNVSPKYGAAGQAVSMDLSASASATLAPTGAEGGKAPSTVTAEMLGLSSSPPDDGDNGLDGDGECSCSLCLRRHNTENANSGIPSA